MRSPSRLTKKKRAAVAIASSAATTNRPRKLELIAEALACVKPRSIITRTACGRISVAADDSARKPSQPVIRPRYGLRYGSRWRYERILLGVSEASVIGASAAGLVDEVRDGSGAFKPLPRRRRGRG